MGMPPDVRARAFEPFFTTKETGRGTGLGLATCWGIVRDAGGTIEIDSAPGDGTVVRVILPAVEGEAEVEPVEPISPPLGATGETVLVVEDEAQLRTLAERTLARAGFRVLTAADGIAALDVLRRHGAGVDLVLTDVVMPRLGGPALARRVREERPDARILFMTGYAESDAFGGPSGTPESTDEVLRKPFTPQQLVLAVRAAIDARRR
jgi:two-component system cell cycle sensor histidine kinase/response regulator CckA